MFLDELKKQAIPTGLQAIQQTMVDYNKLMGRLSELTGKSLSFDEKLERKYIVQALQPQTAAMAAIPTTVGTFLTRTAQMEALPVDIEYKRALSSYYDALKQSVFSEIENNPKLVEAMNRLFSKYESLFGQNIKQDEKKKEEKKKEEKK